MPYCLPLEDDLKAPANNDRALAASCLLHSLALALAEKHILDGTWLGADRTLVSKLSGLAALGTCVLTRLQR